MVVMYQGWRGREECLESLSYIRQSSGAATQSKNEKKSSKHLQKTSAAVIRKELLKERS